MQTDTLPRSKRINAGIYEVALGERVFEIEAFAPSDWLLFEMIDGSREYIQDFWTKRDALTALAARVSA